MKHPINILLNFICENCEKKEWILQPEIEFFFQIDTFGEKVEKILFHCEWEKYHISPREPYMTIGKSDSEKLEFAKKNTSQNVFDMQEIHNNRAIMSEKILFPFTFSVRTIENKYFNLAETTRIVNVENYNLSDYEKIEPINWMISTFKSTN